MKPDPANEAVRYFVALGFLFLVMLYVPHGYEIGIAIAIFLLTTNEGFERWAERTK